MNEFIEIDINKKYTLELPDNPSLHIRDAGCQSIDLSLISDSAPTVNGDIAYLYGYPIGIQCPYCDTFGIKPVKPLVPGAPKTCPHCGGWL